MFEAFWNLHCIVCMFNMLLVRLSTSCPMFDLFQSFWTVIHDEHALEASRTPLVVFYTWTKRVSFTGHRPRRAWAVGVSSWTTTWSAIDQVPSVGCASVRYLPYRSQPPLCSKNWFGTCPTALGHARAAARAGMSVQRRKPVARRRAQSSHDARHHSTCALCGVECT